MTHTPTTIRNTIVCIATGILWLALPGSAWAQEYTCSGNTVDLDNPHAQFLSGPSGGDQTPTYFYSNGVELNLVKENNLPGWQVSWCVKRKAWGWEKRGSGEWNTRACNPISFRGRHYKVLQRRGRAGCGVATRKIKRGLRKADRGGRESRCRHINRAGHLNCRVRGDKIVARKISKSAYDGLVRSRVGAYQYCGEATMMSQVQVWARGSCQYARVVGMPQAANYRRYGTFKGQVQGHYCNGVSFGEGNMRTVFSCHPPGRCDQNLIIKAAEALNFPLKPRQFPGYRHYAVKANWSVCVG